MSVIVCYCFLAIYLLDIFRIRTSSFIQQPDYTAESVRAMSNFYWPRELSSFHRNTDFQVRHYFRISASDANFICFHVNTVTGSVHGRKLLSTDDSEYSQELQF